MDLSEHTLIELTDVVMRFKHCVEMGDVGTLHSLLVSDSQLNLNGRFLSREEFLERAETWVQEYQRPNLRFDSIEDCEVNDSKGFISQTVQANWIDTESWEENTKHGLITFELIKPDPMEPWKVTGLTIAAVPSSIMQVLGMGKGQNFGFLPTQLSSVEGEGDVYRFKV